MGFRFRKNINFGGGFRVNLNKSGVGYSWGTKGIRYTKSANGKTRTTLSVPGTGVSYVSESGGKKSTARRKNEKTTSDLLTPGPNNIYIMEEMVWNG